MRLFTYFRSTASYRVRLAFAYKQVNYQSAYVNLRNNEQNQDYKTINPFGLVPALVTESGVICQSLAIIEYLEKTHPNPTLFLDDPWQQAKALEIAQAICCDIHPLNNLRVLNYLTEALKISDEARNDWYHHWVHEGFMPLEQQLAKIAGDFCIGNTISLADICLIPQIFNANRFGIDMSRYPTIERINRYVLGLDWVKTASPEAQADAD